MTIRFLGLMLAALLALTGRAAWAQVEADPDWLDTPITVEADPATDDVIAERLSDIYGRLEGLDAVSVEVTSGIVQLGGEVANEALADRAAQVARRVEGVVAVDDAVVRTLDVGENVGALNSRLGDWLVRMRNAAPLLALALGAWVGLTVLGRFLARLLVKTGGIPGRAKVNPFLAEVLGQVVRIVFFLGGLAVALNLVGASGAVTTILGGAGVLGIAFGFAIRDTLENYIASILLSIRQPFRTGDHVVVNGTLEGKVARLTSRATVLVTLDGNQLRIPNADVFKGTVLNYTTNPERRFKFELGVDSADDPVRAIETGLAQMRGLDFILSDPEPSANIVDVGDSSIVIEYLGWVDQQKTEFPHARSIAIQAVKSVLESSGFSLPEPIYRLKVDGLDAASLPKADTKAAPRATASPSPQASTPPPTPSSTSTFTPTRDFTLKPYDSIDEQVAKEAAKDNLLSDGARTE